MFADCQGVMMPPPSFCHQRWKSLFCYYKISSKEEQKEMERRVGGGGGLCCLCRGGSYSLAAAV